MERVKKLRGKAISWIGVFLISLIMGCSVSKQGLLKTEELKGLTLLDGEYTGEVKANFPLYLLVLGNSTSIAKVWIKDGRIEKVELPKIGIQWIGRNAKYKGLIREKIPVSVISYQSTNVDAVSGATASSIWVIQAIQKAIDKAVQQ